MTSPRNQASSQNTERPAPHYRRESHEAYRKNKLIRALPDVPSVDAAYAALARNPVPRGVNFRKLAAEGKIKLHGELKDWFCPTSLHVFALQKIVTAIQNGLAFRDLESPQVQRALYNAAEGKRIGLSRLNPTGGGCFGLLLWGAYGTGKTSFVDRLCEYLRGPDKSQVVYHVEINGKACSWPQLKYVRIQCQNTLKGTIGELVSKIDQTLGTNYRSRLGSRLNRDLHVTEITQVLSIHFVGILILEDMQKLKDNEREVLDYLCDFMEDSGIPILMVSTYKFQKIIMSDPSLRSKLTGGGMFDFPLIPYDPSWAQDPDPDVDDWTPFCEGLWRMNTFTTDIPMPSWLPAAVHFHTQGNRRIARKLFTALYDRRAHNPDLKINPDLLASIAVNEIAEYQRDLEALRDFMAGGHDNITSAQAQLVDHYVLRGGTNLATLQAQFKVSRRRARRTPRTTTQKKTGSSKPTAAKGALSQRQGSNRNATSRTPAKPARSKGNVNDAETAYARLKQQGHIQSR